jgi:hypothetical protein
MIHIALLALGIALTSTSALAQTVIGCTQLANLAAPCVHVARSDSSPTGVVMVRLAEATPSWISLSPDQPLARAYALCMREEVGRLDKGCSIVKDRWFSYAPNTEVDRSFINSVARKLSPTSLNE